MLEGVVNGPLTYFAAHMNYTMAEAHCVSIGGHLASVHSTQENSVLTSLCHYEECWIGFNDIDEEGSWKWIDGTVGSYSVAGGSEGFLDGFEAPWQPGEPNGKYWEKTDGAYVYPATKAPTSIAGSTRRLGTPYLGSDCFLGWGTQRENTRFPF